MSLKPFYKSSGLEAGCDEAGRGCLAGPVVAAAVILPKDMKDIPLNDSKQLSAQKREEFRHVIEEKALTWKVKFIPVEEVDELNILNASLEAMHRCLDELKPAPDRILVDGNRFKPFRDIPYHCIVKGDGKIASIAAASILAKTHRDEYMRDLSRDFPDYKWDRNKGYGTKEHREAILRIGLSPHHRRSFSFSKQMKLEL